MSFVVYFITINVTNDILTYYSILHGRYFFQEKLQKNDPHIVVSTPSVITNTLVSTGQVWRRATEERGRRPLVIGSRRELLEFDVSHYDAVLALNL